MNAKDRRVESAILCVSLCRCIGSDLSPPGYEDAKRHKENPSCSFLSLCLQGKTELLQFGIETSDEL